MNTLSLTTPRVIFLVGIPGAGKTFFGKKFADTYGAPFIELEKLRYTLFETPTFSGDEQHRLEAVMAAQFTELLKTKRTIIFEGGLETRSARARLAKQARAAGYKPLFVWVQTEPTTAQQRAVRGGRSNEQEYLISAERFGQLVAQFTAPNHTERFVVISGKHTYPSQAKAVLRHIAEIPQITKAATKPHITVPERPAQSVRKTTQRISLQ